MDKQVSHQVTLNLLKKKLHCEVKALLQLIQVKSAVMQTEEHE